MDNSGTLTTFNNDGAVSYSGTLPINYNLIINSSSDYGQATFSTVSGTMAFGIDIGNSTPSLDAFYDGVFTGLTTSGLSSTSGSSGSYYWELLDRNSDNHWGLNIASSGDITIDSAIDYASSSDRFGFWQAYNDNSIIRINNDISTNSASGFYNSNTDNSTISTKNITTVGYGGYGFESYSSSTNDITVAGDILTSGDAAYGFLLHDSDSNTITLTGDISTTGNSAYGLRLDTSDSNTTTITGNIITSGTDGDSEPILLRNSDSNTFTLSGAVHSLGGDQAIAVDATSQNNTFTFKRGVSFIGGLENNGGHDQQTDLRYG